MNTTTQTKNENYKATVTFIDANRQRATLELEVKDGKFSVSGDCGGSLGQCQDEIKPGSYAQGKLIALWNEWHLNDMKAGTPEQEKAVKAWYAEGNKPNDFSATCQMLREKGLYEVPATEETRKATGQIGTYKYGSAWLMRELPANFTEDLKKLVKQLQAERSKAELLEDSEEDLQLVSDELGLTDSDAELALALGIMFGLRVDEINDIEITENDTRVRVQGVDYLAGTDEEMDEEWDRSLEDYIDDCLEIPENVKPYFDREKWKAAARVDGRAHSLNRYDGSEQSAEVSGTTYYAYRQ